MFNGEDLKQFLLNIRLNRAGEMAQLVRGLPLAPIVSQACWNASAIPAWRWDAG